MHQFPILCSQLGQDSFRTFELCAVDGLSTRAVTFGEVSTLKHELRYDTVEARALVTKTVTSGREFTEVLRGPRDNIVEELEDDATSGLVVDGDVELILSGLVGKIRCIYAIVTHENVGHCG